MDDLNQIPFDRQADELVIDIEEMIKGPDEAISIGPFHYGNGRLKGMEKHKKIMLKRFIERVEKNMASFKIDLDNLVSFVKENEPAVRASYSGDTTEIGEKEFQKMMLVDGAFIIELFLSFYDLIKNIDSNREPDPICRQPKLFKEVTKDLLLLENQLPFFFLQKLYKQAFPAAGGDDGEGETDPSFVKLSYEFFGSLNIQCLKPDPLARFDHFTDLLRFFYLPTSLPPRQELRQGPGNDILLYSAKQLAEVDVRFKASKPGSCPLELKLTNDVLEMPRILVDSETAILFHNMITFEQYHHPNRHDLSDYVVLLNCLIQSHEM